MQGLLSQAGQQPEQQPQQGPQPTQQQPGKQSPHKKVFEIAKKAAGTIIYKDEKTHQAIVKAMKAGDPPTTVGTLAARLVQKIDQKLGNKLPDPVLRPLGRSVLAMLAEVGQAAGVAALESDQDKARAATVMTKTLAEIYQSGPQAKDFVQKAGEHGVRQAAELFAGEAQPQEPQPDPAEQGATDGPVE